MIPRLSDRRIITYGFSPQADVRAVNIDVGAGGSTLRRRHHRPPARRAAARLAGFAADARRAQRAERAGRHRGRATRWASTTTSIRRGARRLHRREAPLHQDRRGQRHHRHRRLRPSPGRDRRGAARRARRPPRAASSPSCSRTATRGSRNLFEEFCTCFNDADTVIVADVYAAGEAPIEGVEPRRAGRRPARARPSQRRWRSPDPEALAALVARAARARRPRRLPRRRLDHHLGARAAGRAGERSPPRGARRRGSRMMAARDATSRLIDRLPPVRGRLTDERAARAASPGSASAARPRCCSGRPTATTSPRSSPPSRPTCRSP